jgi:membrane protein implicated in regulation of membrane protease activity
VIRVGLFAAVLAVLLVFTQTPPWLAAIIAAAFGLATAYLFFRPQRDQVTKTIQDRREGRTEASHDDEDAEDSLEDNDYLSRGDLEGDGPRQQ